MLSLLLKNWHVRGSQGHPKVWHGMQVIDCTSFKSSAHAYMLQIARARLEHDCGRRDSHSRRFSRQLENYMSCCPIKTICLIFQAINTIRQGLRMVSRKSPQTVILSYISRRINWKLIKGMWCFLFPYHRIGDIRRRTCSIRGFFFSQESDSVLRVAITRHRVSEINAKPFGRASPV